MMRLLRVGQQKRCIIQPSRNTSLHQHNTRVSGKASIRTLGLNYTDLAPPTRVHGFRPFFSERENRKFTNARSGRHSTIDPSIGRKLLNEQDNWDHECFHLFRSTGATVDFGGLGVEKHHPTDNDIRPSHPLWGNVGLHREACKRAIFLGVPASVEIQARKLCAETKDDRYPIIYHTLGTQAHLLYLIGRMELERAPVWRPFAHYMLLIAAGLGQLDAALLLHQLHKLDKQLTLQDEQRAVIAKAARDKLDWRAMVAHCEYVISQVKVKHGKAVLHSVARLEKSEAEQLASLEGVQLEECLDLLDEAMSLTGPSSSHVQGSSKVLPTLLIDAETLEIYDAPYKLLYQLTLAQIAAGNYAERIVSLHEHAMRTGALMYRDLDMAANYVKWYIVNYDDRPEDWVECAKLAAYDLNMEICIHLSLYHLKKDGWYPSLAAKTLEEYKRGEKEHRRDILAEGDVLRASEEEKHDAIMRQKNEKLLEAQEGFKWMRIAAQLNIQSVAKMMNRYCIIAGLLRQNGFMEEGRVVLREAEEEIKKSAGGVKETEQALRILDEYLEHWDSRLVHHLLTPGDIAGLLDKAQKV